MILTRDQRPGISAELPVRKGHKKTHGTSESGRRLRRWFCRPQGGLLQKNGCARLWEPTLWATASSPLDSSRSIRAGGEAIRQHKLRRRTRVQRRGIEQWQRAVLRREQQPDLGAAENHRLRSTLRKALNNIDKGLP